MRAPLHNFRSARLTKSAPFLVPIAVVPLVFAGVTSVPAAHGLEARAGLERVRERLDSHIERRDAIADFGALEGLESLAEMSSILRELIPSELSDIEIFSTARIAARTYDVELASVRVEGTTVLELGQGGSSVAMKETRVVGTATLDGLVRWVDHLRVLGIPCSVSSFSILRDRPTTPRFRFEILVGAFHNTPEQPDSSGESGD